LAVKRREAVAALREARKGMAPPQGLVALAPVFVGDPLRLVSAAGTGPADPSTST
jgi:hypothetical protein